MSVPAVNFDKRSTEPELIYGSDYSPEELIENMAELRRVNRYLGGFNTLTNHLLPMIGLLGTLKGMIASFSVIALSDVQLNASEVAGGISEALLLTFEGVALSVPAIYFFALFRNRVAAISVDTMLKADEFLRHFGLATRKKATSGAGAAAS